MQWRTRTKVNTIDQSRRGQPAKKGNFRERLGWTLKAFLVYPQYTNN